MKNSIFLFNLLLLFFSGCSPAGDPCLRNSDCSSNEKCLNGKCSIVTVDASVDADIEDAVDIIDSDISDSDVSDSDVSDSDVSDSDVSDSDVSDSDVSDSDVSDSDVSDSDASFIIVPEKPYYENSYGRTFRSFFSFLTGKNSMSYCKNK